MTDLQKYIATYFGISREDLEKTASLFREQYLPKGEYYTRIGERCDEPSLKSAVRILRP